MLIDIPTRVSGESKTTIDHIITNDIHNVIYPWAFLKPESHGANLLAANISYKTWSHEAIDQRHLFHTRFFLIFFILFSSIL